MKPHDEALSRKWSSNEKEEVRKLILTFGYGRWSRIQKESQATCGVLKDKPLTETQAFANSFLLAQAQCLIGPGNSEMQNFLVALIENRADVPYVQTESKEWASENVVQRLQAHAKRIQILDRVKCIVDKYRSEKKKALARLRKDLQSGMEVDDEDEEIMEKKRQLLLWKNNDNLLNFISKSSFYG